MLPEDIRSYWEKLSSFDEKPDFIHNKSLIPESNIFQFETSIYITPGHEFRVIDELITNFHLPESSLLVLVSSFLGYNETMQLYQKALEKKYRFYSFGDGMYIRVKS